MDASGDQFVAYFLPTSDTMRKRKRDHSSTMDYTDEEEYEYKMAREYNWNVKNKASKGYEVRLTSCQWKHTRKRLWAHCNKDNNIVTPHHRYMGNFLPGRVVNHLPKNSCKLPKFL